MTDKQDKLVWEIEDLQFEIDEYTKSINRRKIILEQKQQLFKQMNELQDRLQNKNWKVETMNANYPLLEVIDETTVKIEGVEYKKVQKEKPITLQRIIAECVIGHNSGMEMEVLENILDRVQVEMLPKKFQSYCEYNEGWNDCIKELKERLRE